MEIKDYQEILKNFKDYPVELGMYYTIVGAQIDMGKLFEKIQVSLNDPEYILSDRDKQKIGISIGDVFYWLTSMISELGLNLEDVLDLNIQKRNLIRQKQLNKSIQKDIMSGK